MGVAELHGRTGVEEAIDLQEPGLAPSAKVFHSASHKAALELDSLRGELQWPSLSAQSSQTLP
eukprot:9473314-Lingulodinium_polyedra.AAC.1